MSWTSVGKYYGLQRPFDFKVAIPFLLNIFELFLVFIVCASLFSDGGLGIGTERFYFFSYVIVLLFIAAAFSTATIVSYSILFWCSIELSLALSSDVLERYGIGTSLLPRNTSIEPFDYGLTYHSLLQVVPKPNWQGRHRYDVRDKDAYENWFLNWTEVDGREIAFSHNSLGLRGIELAEKDLEKDMIFVYGGSTTYDMAVTQGSTWVERLQSELNNKFTVLNFGVNGYSTAEHLIQTAFYQNVRGKRPVCTIYYVGWNDIHTAHIENLDRAYADWHLLVQNPVYYTHLLKASHGNRIAAVNFGWELRVEEEPAEF